VGTDTTTPYSFCLDKCSALEVSTAHCRPTDDKGTVTVSAPIAINVVEIPNSHRVRHPGPGGQQTPSSLR